MPEHIYIIMCVCAPVIIGWVLDLLFGDPRWLPHPVVLFGKMIAAGERKLNRPERNRRVSGAVMAATLVVVVFASTWLLTAVADKLSPVAGIAVRSILVFFCLAGTTLTREVRDVFIALDRSLDAGRRQVARIVGRDTSELSSDEVRTAALETLAENLSDGVVAPLFWYLLLGVPGMMAYKMINTLDSMVGYRTERYLDFGRFAARLDDVANWLPARLTAFLMVLSCGGRLSHFRFVLRYGRCHASPNSGWPEAALAGALGCRFGGPHYYFGTLFPKPYIGTDDRPLSTADMKKAVVINRFSEILMILIVASLLSLRLLF
ncbi:MAG: cobalamin biosynthesis protein CobD [Prevotella sp.]|nr:cobalamin biosynthesis protein CobD [Prevotella sp.]